MLFHEKKWLLFLFISRFMLSKMLKNILIRLVLSLKAKNWIMESSTILTTLCHARSSWDILSGLHHTGLDFSQIVVQSYYISVKYRLERCTLKNRKNWPGNSGEIEEKWCLNVAVSIYCYFITHCVPSWQKSIPF